MQDWLANSVSVKKKMSIRHLLTIIGIVLLAVLILLGTDVYSIVASWENPFVKQLNSILIQPIHDILLGVVDLMVSLPRIVYIILVAGISLVGLDSVAKKMLHES